MARVHMAEQPAWSHETTVHPTKVTQSPVKHLIQIYLDGIRDLRPVFCQRALKQRWPWT